MPYDENSFLQGVAVGRSLKGVSVVSGGGGGGTPTPKQVNFIDYDGTILYSYSAAEAQALQSLPENPSHNRLTAQGWNWTLQQIKEQLTALPDGPVWVGQMYTTQSGDTEIDLRMPDGRLSPILTIAVNGTITVDWGDNTTADTVTGSSLTTRKAVPHTYAAPGEYTMKIHVVSGSFTFYCTTSYTILRKNTVERENRVYENCVQAVRLGSGITSIGEYAFYNCCSLASITIPSSVTSIGNYAFRNCCSLASIAIPNNVTSIAYHAFSICYSLSHIALPSSVTSIGSNAFYNCSSLTSVTIPNSVTSIGGYAFSVCYSLSHIALPSSVTSIGNYAFLDCHNLASIAISSSVTSIGLAAFSSCYSLASITIPSSITNIGSYAFSDCYGMAAYHVKATTPPTIGSGEFDNIVSDCVIYVPAASLSTYQTTTNWSSYASYMQGE